MDITLEDKNSYTKELTLNYEASEIQERYNLKVKKYLPKIQIPGFRPGKVPKSLIKAKFGDALIEEIHQEMIQQDLQKAIQDEIANPIALKEINEDLPKFDEDFKLKAQIEVKPEIELKKFKGLEIEKPIYKPSDEDIDQTIENLRARSATLEEVDKEADMDDFLVVKIDGDMKYLPLSDDVPDETLKKLLGLKKGDKIENGSFEFPKDYIDKTLAGRTVEGDIEVLQVKSKVLPKLDLDFMKTIFPDIEKEEDFRDMIVKNMDSELDSQARSQLESNATRALYDANDVEVPESSVENELIDRFAKRYGLQPDKITPEQLASLKQIHGKDLEITIGARWLLEKIAEEENFEASDEEINAKIQQHSQTLQMEAEKMREILEKRGEIETISTDIVIEKAMEVVLENAEITEKVIKFGDQDEVDDKKQEEDK
ncbi:MAG: trigger factor [Candidatus Zixiibacteriota bacterium]